MDHRPRTPGRTRPSSLLPAVILAGIVATGTVRAQFQDPFSVSGSLSRKDEIHVLSLSFTVPENHYLYKDDITVEVPDGLRAEPFDVPPAIDKKDPQTGEETSFYPTNVVLSYRLTGNLQLPLQVTVGYRGCDDRLCFLPQRRTLSIAAEGGAGPAPSAETEAAPHATGDDGEWRAVADRFRLVRKVSGYLKPDAFAAFLDGTDVANGEASKDVVQSFNEKGILITVLAILLGGLALNLTPCVLPMIPVNIAIIGAGSQAGSRSRGFALGAAYGAGIASVYGILGLAVVLAGARFGALNSSPWFNLAITLLFAGLSLGMFGVINIDLSRFQGNAPSGQERRGGFLPALLMGGVAALLAGACVAPAVISVLLLSANLYQRGNVTALLLPFLLGLGMAIPWPFAGAGLSFLPKPGKWMERVKQGFGIIIMATAVYYGIQTVRLFAGPGRTDSFADLLKSVEQSDKPVLVDFWATWCKNCSKMEKTTFHDPAVQERLARFTVVKYQAEDLNDPEVKAVLTYYGIPGLPTYLVLQPRKQ